MFDESGTNSDVEFFASGDEDDEEEDDESNESADEDASRSASMVVSDINVEEFSVRHGPTKDLATSKDFLNLFSTMIIWMKLLGAQLLMPVQKAMNPS